MAENKRACLISGGGSWGAFGAGTLSRLNKDYDIVVGISSGSLIAPFVALKEWEILKEGYCNITNENVFDSYWYKPTPITKTGRISPLAIIMSIINGDRSIGTSNALRNLIDKYFSEDQYIEIMKQKKEVLVGTQNYYQVPSVVHYFSTNDYDYEEFKDWMWCSANFPFFTSLVKKSWKDSNGNFHVGLWSDGGLTDLVGINQLMGKGYKEIDIILHRTKNNVYEGRKINNLMDNVLTSITAMRYDIEFEFFYERIQKLNKQGTKVTVYWLPRELNKNSMLFIPEKMLSWWNEGYETAYDSSRIEVFQPHITKI